MKYTLKCAVILACVLLISPNISHAFKTINELQLTPEDSYVVTGTSPDGQFGSKIVSGDFNNDNVEDLAISSPLATYQDRQWNGYVMIILGGIEKELVFIQGESAGDQIGRSMSVGDFNNDNIDDLAIGAHNYSVDGENLGAVHLVYGRNDMSSQGFDFLYDKPDLTLTGYNVNEGFGLTVHVDDIDGNNLDDLIVGAPFSSFEGKREIGAAYLFMNIQKNNSSPFSNVVKTFTGQNAGERFSSSIVSGDFNGDNLPELVIGAYKHSSDTTESGKVYIYQGSKNFEKEVNVPNHVLYGDFEKNWFGFSMDSKDIDLDGVNDLVISSFPYNGDFSNSNIKIFRGTGDKKLLEEVISIKNSSLDLILGSDVQIEDVNKSETLDLIIGAPSVSEDDFSNSGNVYVIYDLNLSEMQTLDISRFDFDLVIHGGQSNDWFGSEIAIADINNDDLHDFAISSIYADYSSFNDTGRVDFILGEKGGVWGQKKIISNNYENEVSRGELAKIIIDEFNLSEKKSETLENCSKYMQFCLFNFSAMSSFDGITLEPDVILYPDVNLNSSYYEYINKATILGFMSGYLSQKNSPFKPNAPITRIQALKAVLTATDLLENKYKFEMISTLGSYENLISQKSYFADIDPSVGDMWWYPRYTNFAIENNLIDAADKFRPNEYLTRDELDDLISRTLNFINLSDEETQS